jgi:hypothetical protein
MRYQTLLRAAVAFCLGSFLCSPPAHAQSVSQSRAEADALFREGQRLMTNGHLATACAKLEESQRLDPKLGRLLNVAYCHQQLGRTATAWSEYNQAAALALQTGKSDREKFARRQAGELSRALSFVQLDVTAAPALAQVVVDGRELARDQWPLPLPIDPGSHTLTFAAPGQKTQAQTVTVNAPGTMWMRVEPFEAEPVVESAPTTEPVPVPRSASVSPPPPSASPAPNLPAPSTEEPPRTTGTNRTLGWIFGAIGGAALGVGAGFGFRAISLKNEADTMWCTNHECSSHGLSVIDDAKVAATIATVGILAGAVGVGAGVWFVLRAAPATTKVAAMIDLDRVGVAWRGEW